jgi:hypothetical protein
MKPFVYTLLSDGSSDRVLLRVIDWLLLQKPQVGMAGLVGQAADLSSLPYPPELRDLPGRMRSAAHYYPCDVLFVHRDAEGQPMERRMEEIREAAREAHLAPIPVVPVRMTEAWLLIDEMALRRAADNPAGRVPLDLPPPWRIEQIPDPKERLRQLLENACEKHGRRLKAFKRDLPKRIQRVAELINDFTPLRQLLAFRAFEIATDAVLTQLDQHPRPRSEEG